jgi:predicted class III extradiol MEMO1 family dioxygenase
MHWRLGERARRSRSDSGCLSSFQRVDQDAMQSAARQPDQNAVGLVLVPTDYVTPRTLGYAFGLTSHADSVAVSESAVV